MKKKKERQKRLKEAGDHDEDLLSCTYILCIALNLCHMFRLSEVFCVRSLNIYFRIVSRLLLFEL